MERITNRDKAEGSKRMLERVDKSILRGFEHMEVGEEVVEDPRGERMKE